MEEKMGMVSLSAMVLGFFEEGERREGKEWGGDPLDSNGGYSDEEDGSDGSESGALESKAFWETQHQLLQVSTIYMYINFFMKISRNHLKEMLDGLFF